MLNGIDSKDLIQLVAKDLDHAVNIIKSPHLLGRDGCSNRGKREVDRDRKGGIYLLYIFSYIMNC